GVAAEHLELVAQILELALEAGYPLGKLPNYRVELFHGPCVEFGANLELAEPHMDLVAARVLPRGARARQRCAEHGRCRIGRGGPGPRDCPKFFADPRGARLGGRAPAGNLGRATFGRSMGGDATKRIAAPPRADLGPGGPYGRRLR